MKFLKIRSSFRIVVKTAKNKLRFKEVEVKTIYTGKRVGMKEGCVEICSKNALVED